MVGPGFTGSSIGSSLSRNSFASVLRSPNTRDNKQQGQQKLYFAVTDDNKGNAEGSEEEKILYFFPDSTDLVTKFRVVGLVAAS